MRPVPPTRSSSIWLAAILMMTKLVAAEALSRRSTNLTAVLSSLETELPTCAFECFSIEELHGTSCNVVEDFITQDVTDCLRYNCTTRKRMAAQKLITTTCGTETRSIQGYVRGTAWGLWGAATLFLGGRLLARSRWFGGMTLGNDDWAIIASYAVLTGVTVGAELMVVFGLGLDMWTLDYQNITIVLILFYIAEFAYVIESALTKISILLLYLRIFPDQQFRKQVYALMAILAAFCVAFIVTLLTYCVPFNYTWMIWDNERSGKCIDMNAQTYSCAALNIILDLWIFFMPMPQLSKLELSWKKKVGIMLTFCVGLFVTICSVIRLRYLIGWTQSANATMDYATLAAWSLVELDVGVICACMPGMASLFRRLKQKTTQKYYLSRSGEKNTSTTHTDATSNNAIIMKTTMISVKRTCVDEEDTDGTASESELQLVSKSQGAYRCSSSHPSREMV